VDLTADDNEEEMPEAPATPSPHVSDNEDDGQMETDNEEDLLASPSHNRDRDNSNSDDDGFQHV